MRSGFPHAAPDTRLRSPSPVKGNFFYPPSSLRQGFDRQAGPAWAGAAQRRLSQWLYQGPPVESKLLAVIDAAQHVSFGFIGDGKLLENLGAASGSRKVQLANGRAKIRVHLTGPAAASVTAVDSETVILPLNNSR